MTPLDDQSSRLNQSSIAGRLELELQLLRQQLRGIVEQYETTVKELEVSNEELQALNEELRSTTEELETSKEELQSANEELRLLREELKNKVEEDALKQAHAELELRVSKRTRQLMAANKELRREIAERKRAEQLVHESRERLEIRAQQQQVVADLSQKALSGHDLDSLLNDAVMKVTEGLKVEFCNVLELIPNKNLLLLRAGAGWKKERIGKATIVPGYDSQAGFALLANSAVIVEDLRIEDRFRASGLLLDHGIVSGVSTIIRGRGRAFGVLGAYSPKPRNFSEDGIQFLQAVANVLTTAVERRDLEKELVEISGREQLRIGQDLHDGVCQQLAGIQYAADLIAKKLPPDSSAKAELRSVTDRVREAIVQARNLARGLSLISLESHGLMSALEELAASTQELFQIRCRFDCHQPVLINDNTLATHLYRITQEALHNAIKHGHAENIDINLSNSGDRITLRVLDDGTGLRSGWNSKTGIGLRIMKYRAHIIGGTFSIGAARGKGTEIVCSFTL